MYGCLSQLCFQICNGRRDAFATRSNLLHAKGRTCSSRGEPSQTIAKGDSYGYQHFNGSFITCLDEANGSAAALVNLLVDNFPCLDDKHRFEGRTVRFHKRPQILVADLWACFEGESFGYFHDIEQITMFAGSLNPASSSSAMTDSKYQTTESPKCSTHSAAFNTAHHWNLTSDQKNPSKAAIHGRCNFEDAASGVSSCYSERSFASTQGRRSTPS